MEKDEGHLCDALGYVARNTMDAARKARENTMSKENLLNCLSSVAKRDMEELNHSYKFARALSLLCEFIDDKEITEAVMSLH